MRSKLTITVLLLVGSIAMSALANENFNEFKFPDGVAAKIARAAGFTRPRSRGLKGDGTITTSGAPIRTTTNGSATTTSTTTTTTTTTTKGKGRDFPTATPKNDTFTITLKNGAFTTTASNGTATTWHLKESKESLDKWVKVLLQANRTQIANTYKPIASIAPDFVEFHPDEML